MKRLTILLCVFTALVLAQAQPARCGEDTSLQCMEDCLAPAIETGDPEVIMAAIEACEKRCLPANTGLMGTNGMSGYERGRCISNCASQNRQCLITTRDPAKCHLQYENCKRGCR